MGRGSIFSLDGIKTHGAYYAFSSQRDLKEIFRPGKARHCVHVAFNSTQVGWSLSLPLIVHTIIFVTFMFYFLNTPPKKK